MAALGGMGVVAMTLATVRVTNSAPTPAAISSTSSPQKIDLSSPEATLRSFIAALNRYDVNGAAACVEGGQVSAMLKELPKSLKEFRVSMRVEGLQTSVRKNEATVTVERFVVQQYAAGAPPERRDMTQEIGAQNVFVQRRAGKWKLVPPARIASTEPETSLSRYISLFAMTREVEQTMRAEAYEAVCISNMRQLGLGVFQMSFIANQPLRLKGSLKKNLEAHIRSGGDSGNSVTAARVEPLFHCPADKSDAGSYSFNRNLEGMTQQDVDRLANPRRTVLLYEGKNGRLDFRHNGRATVGFTDGSARLVDRQQAKSLRWK
jgi:prepilin-type processing-associated H-X9-DG protein